MKPVKKNNVKSRPVSKKKAKLATDRPKRADYVTKREKWAKYGWVNVTRIRGQLVYWGKWSRKSPNKTFFETEVKKQATIAGRAPVYTNKYRTGTIQAVYKTPLIGEIGQVKATFLVQCNFRGKKYAVDGYSYLDDCSNYERFKRQIKDCELSAMAHAPCYLGDTKTVEVDFEGTAEIMPDSIRFVYFQRDDKIMAAQRLK